MLRMFTVYFMFFLLIYISIFSLKKRKKEKEKERVRIVMVKIKVRSIKDKRFYRFLPSIIKLFVCDPKITPLMQGLKGSLIRFLILLQQIRGDKKIEILVLLIKQDKILLLCYKTFRVGLLNRLVNLMQRFLMGLTIETWVF